MHQKVKPLLAINRPRSFAPETLVNGGQGSGDGAHDNISVKEISPPPPVQAIAAETPTYYGDCPCEKYEPKYGSYLDDTPAK